MAALSSQSPAPHLAIENFIGEEAAETLLRYCVSHEDAFSAAAVGDGTQSLVDGQIRRSRSLARSDEFIDAVHASFRRKLSDLLPRIVAALGLSPFAPSAFELELVAHNDGAFFARHIDTFTGAGPLPPHQRMVSAVYYFYARPQAFTGGELRLHPLLGGDGGIWLNIEPARDTLVCFPAFAPHEVLPIACPSGAFADSRFAITVWICRDAPGAGG
ncbi:MAG: 2OG-Fe(II) oxygenase [Reyranellaceae bacterium]